jgi:hypothetical protein
MSIQHCRECHQPFDSSDMREDLCRWCLAYELSMDAEDNNYAQRLADGFDMLDDDYMVDDDVDFEDALREILDEDERDDEKEWED